MASIGKWCTRTYTQYADASHTNNPSTIEQNRLIENKVFILSGITGFLGKEVVMIVALMDVVLVWETEEAGMILEMATRGRAVTFIEVLTDIVDVLCQRGDHERTAGPFS